MSFLRTVTTETKRHQNREGSSVIPHGNIPSQGTKQEMHVRSSFALTFCRETMLSILVPIQKLGLHVNVSIQFPVSWSREQHDCANAICLQRKSTTVFFF